LILCQVPHGVNRCLSDQREIAQGDSRIFRKKCIFVKTTGMKRAVGFLFLLLANLNLLAYTAIPHHQHHRIPVALLTAGAHHSDCDEPKSDNQSGERDHSLPVESNHAHTADSDLFADCLLSQAYLLAKQQSQPGQTASEQFVPGILFLPVDDIPTVTHPNHNKPFRRKPFKESYFTNLVRASIGLRAPPAC